MTTKAGFVHLVSSEFQPQNQNTGGVNEHPGINAAHIFDEDFGPTFWRIDVGVLWITNVTR